MCIRDRPRIALVDTFYDEKVESVMAAEALGKRLYGVRLDTPGSRRGDFARIIREVRWELDIRGYKHVKIFVSGGLDDRLVKELAEAGADAFGVGTFICNAPVVDFAMDLVEVEGKPVAKRGKMSGAKQVWECDKCLKHVVTPLNQGPPERCECGGLFNPLLKPLVKRGKIVVDKIPVQKVREDVLKRLRALAKRGLTR